MSYTLNKREKNMLIFLIIILFVFVFVKFILIPDIPQIKEKTSELNNLKNQKEALENDLKNIERKIAEVNSKNLKNQRLEESLMSNASITDSIDFVEKISRYIGKELTSIKINKPEEFSIGEQKNKKNQNTQAAKFFELSMDFDTLLTYDEAYNLIQFCEGSTRKVTISKFIMTPYKQEDAAQANDRKYKVTMRLSFYSQNSGSADKLYEFTRGKFQKYVGSPQNPFTNPVEIKDGKVLFPEVAEETKVENSSGELQLTSADLVINQKGYLYAGNNFELYSQTNKGGRISYKTKDKVNINLRLTDSGFTVETTDENGKKSNINGFYKEKGFLLCIDVDVPFAKENEKLGLDIRVQNDSNRNISVKLKDSYSKVRMYDRNGKPIISKDSLEKLNLI